MKCLLLISILLAVCLSTSVSYARRQYDNFGERVDVVPEDVIDESTEIIDSSEDVDRETVTVMNVLDMTDEILGRKQGRGRMHGRGRGKGRGWKGKCVGLEKKTEMICSRIAAAEENPLQREVLDSYRDGHRHAEWSECCSLQEKEDRMACFRRHKLEQLNAKCLAGPRGFMKKCCKEIGEDRMDCFVQMKRRKCAGKSKSTFPLTTTETPAYSETENYMIV